MPVYKYAADECRPDLNKKNSIITNLYKDMKKLYNGWKVF